MASALLSTSQTPSLTTEDIATPEPLEESLHQEFDTQILPKEIQDILERLTKKFEADDRGHREQQIKAWRRADLFWQGIQDTFYSEIAHDYISVREGLELTPEASVSSATDIDNQVINIYKATGESLIAAIGSKVPKVRFYPVDADSPDDIATSKGYSKIAELIAKQNDAKFLILRILYYLYKHGTAFIYNYSESDKKYGVVTESDTAVRDEEIESFFCPQCGEPFDSPEEQICTDCGQDVEPQRDTVIVEVPVEDNVTEIPKSRQHMRVYGPMYVKIAHWSLEQSELPYLILEREQHASLLKSRYPELSDWLSGGNSESDMDREYRALPTEDISTQNLVTTQEVWFRPWAYNHVEDEAKRAQLLELFPDGVKVTFVDKKFAEAVNEGLDDHWTVSHIPLSDKIHGEALGKVVMPIQEMRTDLVNLQMETITHGISEIYADPEVVDFSRIKDTESRPGNLYPVKQARPGISLESSFMEIRPANLAPEVGNFQKSLDADRQYVSGVMPPIFGGPQGGSRTFAEYETARAQALQRLTISWLVLNGLWAKGMSNAVKEFRDNLLEDEQFTMLEGDNFVNVWIRQSELRGRIGQVEPEASEEFPTSWSEQRAVLWRLFELQDQNVNATLFHPENVAFISRLIGLSDLYVPGDDQRDAELRNISDLMKSEPIPMDPMGQSFQPSIPIDPMIDNGDLHIEICRSWLASPRGADAKETNPAGYMNVLAHLQQHLEYQQQMQMQQMQKQAQQAQNEGDVGPFEGELRQQQIQQADNAARMQAQSRGPSQ